MEKSSFRSFLIENKSLMTLGASFVLTAGAHLSFPESGDRQGDLVEGVVGEALLDARKSIEEDEYVVKRRRSFNDAVSELIKMKLGSMKHKQEMVDHGSRRDKVIVGLCEDTLEVCMNVIEEYDCTGHPNDAIQKISACSTAVQEDDSAIHCCYGMVDVARNCYQDYLTCLKDTKKLPR